MFDVSLHEEVWGFKCSQRPVGAISAAVVELVAAAGGREGGVVDRFWARGARG